MASTLMYCLPFIVLLLTLGTSSSLFSSNDDNFLHCERVVKSWADSSSESSQRNDKLTLKDILFFLHIPRTGGRTYFHCFLRKLYNSDQECPRSYDKLRFNPSKPKCRLVVTHDDYSLMSKLPRDRTSVVTILRNPIDRVFSTYEFSVEVAARFLVHPNLTSAKQMSSRIRPKSHGVSTLDIWPWKYLVPWMREDLFGRKDARRLGKPQRNGITDTYNMEDMIMPLHDFINDPIAHEIIHNGATFQVAGLTNNSCLDESHEVRHCVRKYPVLGHLVLEVAKNRLDQMLYVGLTEDHGMSARMFAGMVGSQVLSQSEALRSDLEREASNKTEFDSVEPDAASKGASHSKSSNNSEQVGQVRSPKVIAPSKGNMTVGKSMEVYETCITPLRKLQSSRRSVSLKRVAPANFSKEARLRVSESVLQQIISLNILDVELYNHAQNIFMRQKHLMQYADDDFVYQEDSSKTEKASTQNSSHGYQPWKVVMLVAVIILIIVFISVAVTARKRTTKVKV